MFWGLLIISLGLVAARNREYVDPDHLNDLLEEEQYEEFARLLGVDVSLVRPSDEEIPEDPIFTNASRYGDFLVFDKDEEEVRQASNDDSYKWPNYQLPVAFTSSFTFNEVITIMDALSDWNNRSINVEVVDQRRVHHQDYVLLFKGNGCWSCLGRIGGQQGFSLGKGCFDRGTVHHHIMHTLGFAHEHNRLDRDDYVKVLWKNILEESQSQYKKNDPKKFSDVLKYDYYSVMHNPLSTPETGKPAFEILKEGVNEDDLGQRNGVTGTDVKKINHVYSK